MKNQNLRYKSQKVNNKQDRIILEEITDKLLIRIEETLTEEISKEINNIKYVEFITKERFLINQYKR